jgi:hypothetical protein
MASKNLTWAILGLCGSLLTVAAPAVTQAAEQPAAQIATSNAKQDTLTCRDLDVPGSHVKEHVCGVPAKWADTQVRLALKCPLVMPGALLSSCLSLRSAIWIRDVGL